MVGVIELVVGVLELVVGVIELVGWVRLGVIACVVVFPLLVLQPKTWLVIRYSLKRCRFQGVFVVQPIFASGPIESAILIVGAIEPVGGG